MARYCKITLVILNVNLILKEIPPKLFLFKIEHYFVVLETSGRSEKANPVT